MAVSKSCDILITKPEERYLYSLCNFYFSLGCLSKILYTLEESSIKIVVRGQSNSKVCGHFPFMQPIYVLTHVLSLALPRLQS